MKVDKKSKGAGESQGGAYPNPHDGKQGKNGSQGGQSGFFGHGGQSDNSYEGGENPNATTED
jgi:hypothetical protein